jgi:hypothetical protein
MHNSTKDDSSIPKQQRSEPTPMVKMAKRIRLTSEDLASPSPKRTKATHERDGVEVFHGQHLNPSPTTNEHLTGSNDTPALNTTEEPSSISQQQQNKDEESTPTQAETRVSRTRNPEGGRGPQEHLRARPSFIPELEMPSTAWLTIPQHNNPQKIFKNSCHRQSAPRRRLPTPPPETQTGRAIKRKRKVRKSNREPGFTIFEDDTATKDNITELEDEYFGAAMASAHDWVEVYIQKTAFEYANKIVDCILPVAKHAGEAAAGEEGSTLEKKLLKWKTEMQWKWDAANLTREMSSGRNWFLAEYVEELADLVDETVRVGGLDAVEIKLETQNEVDAWETMSIKVIGYCQGKGLYGRRWSEGRDEDEDHYDRLGCAWKRIVDYFAGDLWEKSQYIVSNWRWHDVMMRKVLRAKNKILYIEILRARWATSSNHPLATIRTPLEGIAEETVNGRIENGEAGGYFEGGVWIE